MPSRMQIIQAARAYVGTPFHHQGRVRDVGVDCIGLIVCVAQDVGVTLPDRTDYPRDPVDDRLRLECDTHLTKVAADAPGCVLLFQLPTMPHASHVGFFTGATIIHARMGVDRVVEHSYSPAWRHRVAAIYELPE